MAPTTPKHLQRPGLIFTYQHGRLVRAALSSSLVIPPLNGEGRRLVRKLGKRASRYRGPTVIRGNVVVGEIGPKFERIGKVVDWGRLGRLVAEAPQRGGQAILR